MILRKRGGVILLYHRVANVEDDPHLLCVSPENFRSQLRAVLNRLPPLSLEEMVSELERGRTPYGFAVTFDDGYVDNFTEAVPILEELELPATIFFVGDAIGAEEPFYWDRETRATDRGRAMTRYELQQLKTHPLIDVGAHTVSHPHLSTLHPEAQQTEIAESKRLIEEVVAEQVEGFSYPFGTPNVDFTSETIRIVRDTGFRYACANIPGLIRRRADVFTLPRVLIRDWSSLEMLDRLRKYLP